MRKQLRRALYALQHDYGVVLERLGVLLFKLASKVHARGVAHLVFSSTENQVASIQQTVAVSYAALDDKGRILNLE